MRSLQTACSSSGRAHFVAAIGCCAVVSSASSMPVGKSAHAVWLTSEIPTTEDKSRCKAWYTLPVFTGRKHALSCNAFRQHGHWTRVLGTHYPCSRAVNTAREHGWSKEACVLPQIRAVITAAPYTPVFTDRVDGPRSQVMWTGAREHDP